MGQLGLPRAQLEQATLFQEAWRGRNERFDFEGGGEPELVEGAMIVVLVCLNGYELHVL